VESPDISVDKFCIFPTSIEGFQAFCDKYQNVLDFIDRGEGFFEVIPKGYSKASGIEFLINYLNIPHENTFAIGDSSNDLPMLEYVKHSIAMGNASKVVLDMASFVTKDVDEDGIAFALKHFHII
jgi:Cof subfamily protein (haloacid dehalogenase superfamily)